MKTLNPALQAHLDTGATTLCYCWKVTRADGAVRGYTDHDRALAFGGDTYEAASGFTATAIESNLGLGIDNLDVAGGLSTASLSEEDLAAGLYDAAEIEIWRVNWSDVSQRVLMRKGAIGEVRRAGPAFTAELRGLAHRLNQQVGRIYQYGCDADLGDARCTIDRDDPGIKGEGAVAGAANRRQFAVSGIGAFAHGFFERGKLTWTAGANAGHSAEVKRHTKVGATVTLELWLPVPQDIAPGDAFAVTAGCDKQFATCKAKFVNQLNFRGFPHMPGNDWVVTFPARGNGNDGGRRNG